jgi:hypothetical protein
MRLLHVIGTRPNFVKMAPVVAACRRLDPDGRLRVQRQWTANAHRLRLHRF